MQLLDSHTYQCMLSSNPLTPLSTADALASVPPDIRSDAEATYDAAHKAVTEGLSTSRLRKDNTAWKQWDTFCTCLHIPHYLQDISDKIPFLQIFSHKVRTGVLAANNKPIQKRSVEQYIRSMGQIFAAVGSPDPIRGALHL